MKPWFLHSVATAVLWGVWGAFTDLPQREHGFPGTLSYVVWSVTMLLPAAIILAPERFRVAAHPRALWHGFIIGVPGAAASAALFKALELGPAYLVFPILALSPLVTIALSFAWLGERTGRAGTAGVTLAMASIVLFSLAGGGEASGPVRGTAWLWLALGIMAAWGVQAYYIKIAGRHMSSGSIFFYIALGGVLVAPVAWAMTDFTQPINWSWSGPGLAALIQLTNAIGAYTFVLAFRDGRAIIVAPLCNALYPIITVAISLVWYRTLPGPLTLAAIAFALVAAFLMIVDEQRRETPSAHA